MALFLEVHEVDRQSAEAFVEAWSAKASHGVRCLKHWLGEDGHGVALLVEAPDEEKLLACHGGAKEVTELFAPAERWTSFDSIEAA